MADDDHAGRWIVPFDGPAVDELRDTLIYLDQVQAAARRAARGDDWLEFLVDRFGKLKIEIFADEHPPPHFRVKSNSETANYRIADCHQLNGGLARELRIIQAWHSRNKQLLIDTWNARRPSDCPVGEYRAS